MYNQQNVRPERVTSYNSSGRPVARCHHPYWNDVNPIRDTFDREGYLAKEAKFASDYKALTVRLQSTRVLYAL
jgi:hypothetical protein